MTSRRPTAPRRLWRAAHAEFLKVWASRMPLIFMAAIPVLCYVVVFEIYHVERAGEAPPFPHALAALPALFFVIWKMLLFQASVLTFAAFWTTVDSQYGMLRVVSTQPLSRAEHLLGKWLGVAGHVGILTLVLILSTAGWATVYSGISGIRVPDLVAFVWFSVELLALTLSLAGIGLAVASFRRTVGSGIITALLAFIGLSVMSMLPFDVFPPRWVFVRYFFFPLQEFASPFGNTGDNPFVRMYSRQDFSTVMLVTPLLFALPAIAYFTRRDITE